MKVSIIVPIYNGERYIKTCLESIINQTYKNIEIILVDDGSTDKSLNICNEFSKKDSRIKVISQKNSGVSSARNRGILESSGEVIGFVDIDDIIDLEMYSKLVSLLIRCDVDISICGVKVIRENKEELIEGYNLDSNVAIFDIYKNIKQFHQVSGSVWQCLYRRELIVSNKIKFEEKITIGEDSLFNLKSMRFAKSIAYIDEPLYTYIHHKDSAVRGYKEQYYNEIIKLKENKIKYLEELGINNENNRRIVNCTLAYNIINYIKMIVLNMPRKQAIKKIENLLKDKFLKDVINLNIWKESNLKLKILIILCSFNNKYIIYHIFNLIYRANI